MKEIRLLKASEIECRVATINEKGLSLLLYKDARVDYRLLDETFGNLNWRRTHQSIDGNLYCTVEVYDPDKKEWVAKQDVGVPGYAEQAKSQASDSFKRACFALGIGRELYSAPFIWIPFDKVAIQKRGEKFYTNDRFRIQSISYNEEREISALTVVNAVGNVVYELKEKKAIAGKTQTPKVVEHVFLSKEQEEHLLDELDRTGVELQTVLKRYKIQKLEEMTEDIYVKAMGSLKKTKNKLAA